MTTPLGSSLHPLLRLLVKAMPAVPTTGARTSAPGPAPAGLAAAMRLLERRRPSVPVRDEQLTRPDGTSLRVRVYDPAVAGVRPVLVYAHGGGFRIGNTEGSDGHLQRIADRVGAVVVSVDYRLIPEHPYPAALEDALLTLQWISDQAPRLRVDASRLALAGASAGGNLVLATAFAMPPHLPRPRLLVLEEPWLDLSVTHPAPPAAGTFYDPFVAELGWGAQAYAGALDPSDVRVSPGLVEDLSGLPPVAVLVGDLDILLPQHLEFVERMRTQGGQATLHVFPGLTHGVASFTRMGPAHDYETAAIAHLRSELVVAP